MTHSLPQYESSSLPKEWNVKMVQYLYRRVAFGLPYQEYVDKTESSPEQIVDDIIDETLGLPLSKRPRWYNWSEKKYQLSNGKENEKLIDQHTREWTIETVKGMFDDGFRGKLVLFWSNHFVTSYWHYVSPQMLYQYHRILQEFALGNFREMVIRIGLTPAMLMYLNGEANNKEQPNENYARELLELFTLGRDNGYTQEDIREIARAFTGYTVEDWNEVAFNDELHDNGAKTIFGKKGNWTYDDVIELLFEERGREIAEYISRTIYKEFACFQIDEDVVQKMAKAMIEHDFELAPVFRVLLKHPRFYDESIQGTKIKSPYELYLTFLNELGMEIKKEEYFYEIFESAYYTGQALFSPPNVAGWKGQRNWINSTRLTRRWEVLSGILYQYGDKSNFREWLMGVADQLTDEKHNPEIICLAIIDYFLPLGLSQPNELERAVKQFKGEWDEELFENGWWNLDREDTHWQIAMLIHYLIRLPEFHVC